MRHVQVLRAEKEVVARWDCASKTTAFLLDGTELPFVLPLVFRFGEISFRVIAESAVKRFEL